MLTLWGKGGYGGIPNVEAGKGVHGGSGETPRGPEGTTGGSEQATRPHATSAPVIQGEPPGCVGSEEAN
jgi:hypothetical protein